MTEPSALYEQLLPQIVSIAKNAGRGILRIYGQPDEGVRYKADQSPLTEADLLSHRLIVDDLARLTPALPVLSEESAAIPYSERAGWQSYWLVDPLDGTKEFVKRNGEFTVNIALVENGTPVLGVVYAPVLGVCYAGAEGLGAFVERGDEPRQTIRVRSRQAEETLKVVASRSHRDERTTALLEHFAPYECISMGSSLKFCLVAEGRAHFYPRLGPTMEWDTAAAQAVVKAAGGNVCDLSGASLRYNKADLHNPEFFVFSDSDPALLETVRSIL